MGRAAFDIETVSPDVPHDEYPDFEDPDDFEFLISAVGYQPAPGDEIETELFFRDGWGPAAELDVIEATLDWLDARDVETLFTYNGSGFDLIHFEGRAERASAALGRRDGVADRVRTFLDGVAHDDLRDDAVDVYGGYPSLEDVCFKNDIDVAKTLLSDYDISEQPLNETRSSKAWGKPDLQNEDVPVLGEAFLDLVDDGGADSEAYETLREAFAHYARGDIRPLFHLADARPFAPLPDA